MAAGLQTNKNSQVNASNQGGQARMKVMNGLVVEYLIDRYEDKWKEPTVNTEVSGFRYTLAFIWCPDICPRTLSDLSSEQFRRAILENTCELRGTDNVNFKERLPSHWNIFGHIMHVLKPIACE
ncbi:hypothetical protein pdam_00025296 [Pocillopora damicornis]|uniref:Uncharacterized protein n=1 Tax=Pocillopora damicornis TaxID=46731 RepID=A0A3M6UM97_POCDA|nr:hypothetical protein pdam_00025296 [Pocillopora damicornis]